ncbi:phosphatase PAP2 family protein [Kitasatospora sp. DSM 101779]|uniref:phosphatase PAP2 family protein n=1 Tax=Kitasatospora sp. DSM 101779 TaxID=2853165 RepID=UPI0021D957B1|nr:phosphatase PAP2 family protein [Kitasatospora sp. DSM 101779]MCU7820596.1 phosphatase PAP2 family protein [Kitasatospora sp. DSM 101779]
MTAVADADRAAARPDRGEPTGTQAPAARHGTRTALAVLVGAWAGFTALALLLVVHGTAPFGWERDAIDWSGDHRPGAARVAASAVTSLGSALVPYAAAIGAGLLTARHVPAGPRRLLVALAPLGWLAAGQLLRTLIMHGTGRPRPPVAGWAATASGFSFPSGHTFTSATAFGLLAWAIGRHLAAIGRPPAARRRWTVLLLGVAALVGLSRVYLAVHWPLDILGGWLLAAGWLALGALLARRIPWWPSAPPEPQAGARADGS